MTCGPGERHLPTGCCGQLLEHDLCELTVGVPVSFSRTGRFVSRYVISHRVERAHTPAVMGGELVTTRPSVLRPNGPVWASLVRTPGSGGRRAPGGGRRLRGVGRV